MKPENLEKLALSAMKINIMAASKNLSINIPIVSSTISTDAAYQMTYISLLETCEALIKERIENLKLREQLAEAESKISIERWMLDQNRQGGA